MQTLAKGTLLHNGTYRIEQVLGQGGFGITYLATDLNLQRLVAIKEFFPKEYCERDETTSHVSLGTKNTADFVNKLKAKFLKEARNIAKFDHPNIIRIFAAFEENNTAYYVMEYIEGESLSSMVHNNGKLPEKSAVGYIAKVGSALDYIHQQKLNHLDVKPANIMVRRSDDTPILIDFGLSKQYDSEGKQTSTTPTGISHGFAPLEQYSDGGVKEFAPQTDIYSLAATLYYLLSGNVPLRAPDRGDEDLTFPKSIPERLVAPISRAMSLGRKGRHTNVTDFISDIEGHGDSASDDTVIDGAKKKEEKEPTPKPPKPLNPTPKPNRGKVYIIAAVVVAAIIGALIFLVPKPQSPGAAGTPADTTKTEVADTPNLDPVIQNLLNNMVYVEGGTFEMGSDDSEAYPSEKPVHQESVGSFHIGKYEVTQKEWEAVMGSNPSGFKGDDLPVENVSWDDCQEFINKLNNITGKKFRLPTEAEWEYAARGGYRYDKQTEGGDLLMVKKQLKVIRGIRSSLYSDLNTEQVLTTDIGIKNPELDYQIVLYNSKILERNKLRSISSNENPLVQSLDNELNEMKSAIIASLDKAIVNLEYQSKQLQSNNYYGYKYSGSNNINDVAWYDGNSGMEPHTVGAKSPNELGLHDMTGNVWEWTSSHWSDNYNSPRSSSDFVCRGGGWNNVARYCRASYRVDYARTYRFNNLGLRLAHDN